MDWTWTLIALAASLAITFVCGWMGARAPDPHRGPRLVPYRFLMLLGGAGVILMLIHLASLAGLRSDRN